MSRANAIRESWHPQTREDREAVLQELEQILSSPHFSNSKRYPALLRYVVEGTLAGKSDLLKERTLGVEVFDRPASYDTNTDTVVRYTAGEVRKRLALYYSELDRKPLIQISLPPGSYIPEFIHAQEEHDHAATNGDADISHVAATTELIPATSATDPSTHPAPLHEHIEAQTRTRWATWWLIAAAIAVIVLAISIWRYQKTQPVTALNDFWAPVLHDQKTVLLCTGGVVFSQNNFSGVVTAGKDIEYPFVSFQIATAISHLSGLIERNGATVQLQSSPSTPLNELRDRPVILLGGYNNQWTMRLIQAMPIHFTPEPDESIRDTQNPNARWVRDRTQPYSSADDYALVARFRDTTTTDGWVVVVAGLGRNGTEAASQIVTSPHYMQLFRDKLGSDFASKNVEALVKISVIDGKTGAPSLITIRAW
jgi:hypothetical protein